MRSPASPFGVASLGGAAASLGALAHAGPAVVAWRSLRCRLTPRLAGIGHPHHVALTFDDGPDPVSTPAFLDALDALRWRATFFLLGEQVRRAPRLARQISERGHEVGVHGDKHVSHLRRSSRWTTTDVARACDLIADTTGTAPEWFRPPYGAVSASALVAANRTRLRTVLWTSWGRDWAASATAQSVAREVVATLQPGATVLLHDSDLTSAAGSWRSSLGALRLLEQHFDENGLSAGPLSEHGLDRRRLPAQAGPEADRPASGPSFSPAAGSGAPRSSPRATCAGYR